MGAMGLIITRRVPFEEHMRVHADGLMNLAKFHGALYPSGSETPNTKAEIWSEPEAFKYLMDQTIKSTSALVTDVSELNRRRILNRLVQVGESCASCHGRFRAETN